MSLSPILALLLSFVAILGGNALEGGHFSSLVQPTAAMIVMGGTIGATWLAATDEEIKHLMKLLPRIFRPKMTDRHALLDTLMKIANMVRRDGMLSVEAMLPQVEDEFLRRGLRAMVDGYSAEQVKGLLELDMDIMEHHGNATGKVLETAGGFAPTIGILGAVLGLIHVMQNLSDPSKLGTGIAVAFVATIYGVGVANIIFIPLGNRLKKIIASDIESRVMIVTGIEIIMSGTNPRQVEETLVPFMPHAKGKKEAA